MGVYDLVVIHLGKGVFLLKLKTIQKETANRWLADSFFLNKLTINEETALNNHYNHAYSWWRELVVREDM